MSKAQYKEKPVMVECHNCHHKTLGFRNIEGVTKVKCSRCGMVTVSSIMSRRHVRLDLYAPKGQELIDAERYTEDE